MIARALGDTTAALHAALISVPDVLAALGGDRLYDAAPQKAAYPYAVFGEISGRDWSGTAFHGTEATWRIEVFSRQRGRAEANAIARAIEQATTVLDLTPPGLRIVNLRVARIETARLRDGRTFRARLSLTALIEAA